MPRERRVNIKVGTLWKLSKALDRGDLSTIRRILDDCLDFAHQERVRQAKRELYEARQAGRITQGLYEVLYQQLEDSIP